LLLLACCKPRLPASCKGRYETGRGAPTPWIEPAGRQRARYWKIVNEQVVGPQGQPVGYKLVPQASAALLADPESHVARVAGFATKHLWVTPVERVGFALRPAGLFARNPALDLPTATPHCQARDA
jgi:Cu2+-containing amine oxidase